MKISVEKNIETAFIELYSSKEFASITVKEICSLAGVSRATFYTYYEDTRNLLSDIERRVTDDIDNILKGWDYYDINRIEKNTPIQLYVDCYKYVHKNKKIFKALFGACGDNEFIIRYNERIRGDYLRKIERYQIKSSNPQMLASLCAGSVIYTSRAWIFDDISATPYEIALMTTKAVLAILNCG